LPLPVPVPLPLPLPLSGAVEVVVVGNATTGRTAGPLPTTDCTDTAGMGAAVDPRGDAGWGVDGDEDGDGDEIGPATAGVG
jgi:hypothetical protein